MKNSAQSKLRVNAFELLRRPGTVKDVHLESDAESLSLVDDRLVHGRPVAIDLMCESLSDGIVVHGHVGAEFAAHCRRCLEPILGRIDVEVHELYQVTVTDPDAFPIENDQIDLVPMVRETILLELPDAPLCRPDCAGLCPVCGRDLNESRCDCPTDVPDARWSALDALRDQLPE